MFLENSLVKSIDLGNAFDPAVIFDTFGDKPQRLALGSQSRKPEGLRKKRGLVALPSLTL